MTIKDKIIAWYLSNIYIPKFEVIDKPGYICEHIGEQKEIFLREIALPENLFVELEKIIVDTFRELSERGLSEAEVEKAKDILNLNYEQKQKTAWGRAYTLGQAEALYNLSFALNYKKEIEKVAVEDIKRVINTYIREDNYTVIIMKPELK